MLLLLSEYFYQTAEQSGLWLRGSRFTIRTNPLGMMMAYRHPKETPDEADLLGMTPGYQQPRNST